MVFLTFFNVSCLIPMNFQTKKSQDRKISQSPQNENLYNPNNKDSEIKERKFYDFSETDKVSNDALEQLNNQNFLYLEDLVAKARKDKELLPGGHWKLKMIYWGLGKPRLETDNEYQKHIERLKLWKLKFPNSITPRVALADSWISYAYHTRGEGYADTVSEESWKLFRERLENAESELVEARNLQEKCPQWYLILLTLARLQSWSRDDFESVYQQAIAFEPRYYYFYREKVVNLLVRWNGQEGESEEYLNQLTNSIGGKEGEIIYYLLYSELARYRDLSLENLSWKKAKRGYSALKEKNGGEITRLSEYAKLSFILKDYAEAHKSFDEIGDKVVEDTWGSKDVFMMIKYETEQKIKNTPPESLPNLLEYKN